MPSILWQTFLYTGLFITSHDAMHGVVSPQNTKINHLIGTLTLSYMVFTIQKIIEKTLVTPPQSSKPIDPDFHNGKHKNFFRLVFSFYERLLELGTNNRVDYYL